MAILRLDHYTIRTLDLEASRRFYTDVMGFQVGPRPPFKFPGLWLYAGAPGPDRGALVHLVGIDPEDAQGLKDYLGERSLASLKGTGSIDHIAFAATDLAGLRGRLKQLDVPYREKAVPDLALQQLFLEDPSGVTLELNFPGAELAAG